MPGPPALRVGGRGGEGRDRQSQRETERDREGERERERVSQLATLRRSPLEEVSRRPQEVPGDPRRPQL